MRSSLLFVPVMLTATGCLDIRWEEGADDPPAPTATMTTPAPTPPPIQVAEPETAPARTAPRPAPAATVAVAEPAPPPDPEPAKATKPGQIQVRAPLHLNVFIDGRRIGFEGSEGFVSSVSPGRHEVLVKNKLGKELATMTVEVPSGQCATVQYTDKTLSSLGVTALVDLGA